MRVLNTVKSLLGADANDSSGGSANGGSSKKVDYTPLATNWYRTLPYGFAVNTSSGDVKYFFLPINPSNLSITTHFATNVTATLYGVVEEHSEQRFFDISIQGTTGIVPQYYKEEETTLVEPSASRASYLSVSLTSANQGFFAKTLGRIEQVINKTTSTIQNAIGKSKPHEEGFDVNKTGYMAFHNFYNFLLSYKKEIDTKKTKGIPITFLNYKDQNMYSCVVQSFTMERDASNPMLYNYSIKLKAYDLRPMVGLAGIEKDDLSKRIKDLHLDSNPSIYTKTRLTVASARGAVNSALGAASSMIGR